MFMCMMKELSTVTILLSITLKGVWIDISCCCDSCRYVVWCVWCLLYDTYDVWYMIWYMMSKHAQQIMFCKWYYYITQYLFLCTWRCVCCSRYCWNVMIYYCGRYLCSTNELKESDVIAISTTDKIHSIRASTKDITSDIWAYRRERDNIPYDIATNMTRRRLQAHLMIWIGADLQQGTIHK